MIQTLSTQSRTVLCASVASIGVAGAARAGDEAAMAGPIVPAPVVDAEHTQPATETSPDPAPGPEAGASSAGPEAGGTEPEEAGAVAGASPTESLPLGASSGSGPALGGGAGRGVQLPWWVQTGGALAIVIALALLLRGVVTRLAGASGTLGNQLGAGGRAPSGVLQVLGRYPVTRGHTLVLLHVDQRVVLLGQSSAGFRTLSEFTRPDEVASLLTKTRDEEGSSMTARFNEMLKQVERDPKTLDPSEAAPIPEGRDEQGQTGLRAARRRLLGLGGAGSVSRSWTVMAMALAALLTTAPAPGQSLYGPPMAGETLAEPSGAPVRAAGSEVASNPMALLEDASNSIPGFEGGLSSALNILLLVTVLTLVPSIMVMCTCFVRFIIVLGLLKQAMGTQTMPPAQVTTGLALFMTILVMAPTAERMHDEAIAPYQRGEITNQLEMWDRAQQPLRDFMFAQIDAADNWSSLFMLMNYRGIDTSDPASMTRADVDLLTLIPGYMLSEIKVAFLMGFRVYMPFLIIDMVIASLLISMSMMMLPPVLISLPFKLLLFVLVDGWQLVVGSLMTSVAQPEAVASAGAAALHAHAVVT